MFRTIIAALAVIFIASSAQASDKNFYLETQVGTTVKADDGRDNSNIMGLAIGKYLPGRPIRVELAGVHASSGDDTPLGEVEVNSLLGGAYYDFNTGNKFTPFAGAHAGYGWADGLGVSESKDSGLVYGVSAGVSYALIDTIDFTAQYQMLTSNSIDVTNASGVEDWDSQAITVGVRYGF